MEHCGDPPFYEGAQSFYEELLPHGENFGYNMQSTVEDSVRITHHEAYTTSALNRFDHVEMGVSGHVPLVEPQEESGTTTPCSEPATPTKEGLSPREAHAKAACHLENDARHMCRCADDQMCRSIKPDVSTYAEQWTHDELDSSGCQEWPDGRRYQGQLKGGRKNGEGVFVWASGAKYAGQFVDNEFEGQGVCTWTEGHRYDGMWAKGKKQGQGVFTWSDGRRYDGEYAENQHHGFGTYKWPDGCQYIGQFQDGLQDGFGEYTTAEGHRYKGQWVQSKKHGKGTLEWSDGRVYAGDYIDDRQHGVGTLRWPDGREYAGQWLKGKQDGTGRYYLGNGEEPILGAWEAGELLASIVHDGYHQTMERDMSSVTEDSDPHDLMINTGLLDE